MSEIPDLSPIGIARTQHGELYRDIRVSLLAADTHPAIPQDAQLVAKNLAQFNYALDQSGFLSTALYEGADENEYKIDEVEIAPEGIVIIAISPPLKVRLDILADSSQVAITTVDEETDETFSTDLKPNVGYTQDALTIIQTIPMEKFSVGSTSI